MLQREGFVLETSVQLSDSLWAHLWVAKGLLVYEAPPTSGDGSAGAARDDSRSQIPGRVERSSSTGGGVSREEVDGGALKLPSTNLGGPGGPQGLLLRGEDPFASFPWGVSWGLEEKGRQTLRREYEGARLRLQQSAWRAFQAALWFVLTGSEEEAAEERERRSFAAAAASQQLQQQQQQHERASRKTLDGPPSPPPTPSLGLQRSMQRTAVAVDSLRLCLHVVQLLAELQTHTLRDLRRSSSLGLRGGAAADTFPLWSRSSTGLGRGEGEEKKENDGGEAAFAAEAALVSRATSEGSSFGDRGSLGAEEEAAWGASAAGVLPEKLLITERLIDRTFILLLGCVRASSGAALLLLKTLLLNFKGLPVHLEAVLRTLPVKTRLYELMTECVRRLGPPAAAEAAGAAAAAGGGVSMLGAPGPMWGGGGQRLFSRESSADTSGCRLLPPLQAVSLGSLLHSAGPLLQLHQEPPEAVAVGGPLEGPLSAAPAAAAGRELPLRTEGEETVTASGDGAVLPVQQQETAVGSPWPAGAGGAAAAAGGPSPMEIVSGGVEESGSRVSSHAGGGGSFVEGDGGELFAALPQSEVFLCGVPSDEFQAEVHGRTLHVLRARELGGVAICRAPLTFPALQVEPGEAADVIGFRVWSEGRFGVTVAPADCVLSAAQDIFERNDVVGFRTSSCPPFWGDVFATTVSYQPGDYLSVRFSVDEQPNGQRCLHTELHVSGESIGSVLEVFYDQHSQIEQRRRMNLVFVLQDPLTLVYGGPDFTLQYTDPDALPSSSQQGLLAGAAGGAGGAAGVSAAAHAAAAPQALALAARPPLSQQTLRSLRLHPLVIQSLRLYQAVLQAPEKPLLLRGERRSALQQLALAIDHCTGCLGSVFESLCCSSSNNSQDLQEPTGEEAPQRLFGRGDSLQLPLNRGLRDRRSTFGRESSGELQQQMLQQQQQPGGEDLKGVCEPPRRQTSTGLRPCPHPQQQRAARAKQEMLQACRRGVAALGVLCCDCSGRGELQDVLERAERQRPPGTIDPDGIHPSAASGPSRGGGPPSHGNGSCCCSGSCRRSSSSGSCNCSCNTAEAEALGLPWLVSTSCLHLSAVAGLRAEECEALTIAVCELLTSPVVQGTLHQIAAAGHVVAPSAEWAELQALALTLGSKAVVALCLLLRALLQQQQLEGDPRLSERAKKCLLKVFLFMEQFCLLTSGLASHQIDPFGAEEAPDCFPSACTSTAAPAQLPLLGPQQRSARSASVPDLRLPAAAPSTPSAAAAAAAVAGGGAPAGGSGAVPSAAAPHEVSLPGAPAGRGFAAAAAAEATEGEGQLKLARIARLCGVPECVLQCEEIEPLAVSGEAVLAAGETAKVWSWVYRLNEAYNDALHAAVAAAAETVTGPLAAVEKEIEGDIGDDGDRSEGAEKRRQLLLVQKLIGRGWDCAAASLLLLKPRQEGGYIHFKGPVDVRVFNYEGACSLWSSRMLHRLLEPPLRWALRRDALHLVCTIVALCPDLLLDRLYK